MDSLETDDQLIIINRSMEHRISKKLIRKIPYFERMLSHEYLESKENKVELDFDEKALKSILDWIKLGFILIEMDCVINMSIMADYFGISDRLMNNFVSYFHENFSIEHLPVIIPQVTSTSKLVNSGALNAFICRYFLKIVETPVWLRYPIETIRFICVLDLMVHSEYQVFDAIMRWLTFKADSRDSYLEELLKSIRWCFMEDKDLVKVKENRFVKDSNLQLLELQLNRNCSIDRTKQGCFVVIEELSDQNLRAKVLDGNFFPLIKQVIKSDKSLPLHLLHDEHISDIFFDSGRKMIRIDWKHNKYRYMDYKSHYQKVHNCIYKSSKCGKSYLVAFEKWDPIRHKLYELSLLEACIKFILVRNESGMFRCWESPTIADIDNLDSTGHTYLATVLDNNIYMLTDSGAFFQFNIDRELECERIEFKRLQYKLNFSNCFLTSKQVNDDRVIFVDKTTRDVVCFNVSTREWKSIGRIIDYESKSSDGREEYKTLKTFTFGFVSTGSINLCLERDLNAIK